LASDLSTSGFAVVFVVAEVWVFGSPCALLSVGFYLGAGFLSAGFSPAFTLAGPGLFNP
jgi:hypothetical protein